jgi:hypothetical protein
MAYGEYIRLVFESGDELCCPNCGGRCLHHGRITVFDRREDDPEITVTTVTGGKVRQSTVSEKQANNPSRRRHGLAIEFECEMCSAISELTIAQHKGSTYFGWRLVAEDLQPLPIEFLRPGAVTASGDEWVQSSRQKGSK